MAYYQFCSKLLNKYAGGWLFLLFSLFSLSSTAFALPVGFKDSWMTMGELSKDYSDVALVYTFGQKTSLLGAGVEFKWQHSPTQMRRVDMVEAEVAHRLARWNLPEAQANIYLQGGIGSAGGNFFTGRQTVGLTGVQLDYETRRLYAALKWHGSYTKAFNYTRTGLSTGFSFYKTEYDEWQPWLIVEATRVGGDAKDATEFTPYIRFIHKTLFVEAGAPFKRGKSEGLKLNFRYTF
jgi:hypothetical protein